MKKILAIGPKTLPQKNYFSGQAVMFEGFVNYLCEKGKCVDVVDISSKFSPNTSGRFSFVRAIEYIGIIAKIFFKVCVNKYSMLYLTTAQSKVGFIRDFLIVSIVHLFGIRIFLHQFGANYSGFYDSLSPFFKKKLIKMLNKADKIIVEGDYTKNLFSFMEDYLDKVVAIPNGLPGKNIEVEYECKTYNPTQTFNMIYLSNMIESKGYLDVLKAVNLLVNVHKRNVHCVFAGKYIVTADIQQNSEKSKQFFNDYIKQNNLTNNVKYFEGLYGDLKEKAFKDSHAFLLPSYYINEGQPLAVLEAMAYGNVCVVTNYRLIPDMVDVNNGVFVEAKSPESIAEKIIYLMANTEAYGQMSKAAIVKYRKNHTFDIYCEKILTLFENS